MEGHQPEDVSYGGFGPDLPCHRGSKSMAEELGDSELPTGGSAPLFQVKHCGV